jgi:hypothetical protein
LPASTIAGPSDNGRAGAAEASVAVAVEASVEAGVVAGRAGAFRGRVAGCVVVLFRVCADVGCGEVSRAKSSRMFRAASQPDKSNSPTPTVRFISPLIVILSTQRASIAVETPYGLNAAR